MRRIKIGTVVALVLTAMAFTYSQSPRSRSRTNQTGSQAKKSEAVKAKKLLVKELPKGLEGIVLEDGVFRLKPGYRFVKPSANTLAVALDNGGGNVGGTINCYCSNEEGTATGSCKVTTDRTTLVCRRGTCDGSCELATTIDGNRVGLAIY